MNNIEIRRYSATKAGKIIHQVAAIYEAANADRIRDDPFRSVDAFMTRFRSYVANPDLDMVVAFLEDEAIGQAWGWPLGRESLWWDGLVHEPYPGFTLESGKRTFALSEIMVKKIYTGRGYAHAMHDYLLQGRSETRATLLTAKDNSKAYTAYLRWGWTKVAELRPDWPDAPTFDVLMHDL